MMVSSLAGSHLRINAIGGGSSTTYDGTVSLNQTITVNINISSFNTTAGLSLGFGASNGAGVAGDMIMSGQVYCIWLS